MVTWHLLTSMWFHFHFVFLQLSTCIFLINSNEDVCTMSCDGQTSAVVVYDESKLSPLVKPSRTFSFLNQDIVIQQDWGKLGVAAVVWDAAIVLCEFIEKWKEEFKGKEAIELGAGSGLVGIVAALSGANVEITDRETVFPYMRKVVKENLRDKENIKYSVKVLDWTKDLHKYNRKYEVIFGADVIYVEEIFDALLETLLHLSDKETKVYLSCKIRYDRDTNFLDMMRKFYDIEEILYDGERDIKIFLCKLK